MAGFEYDIGFLVLLLLVTARVRHKRRALLWLGAGALSYIISAFWHRAGWPSSLVAAAACDAVIVLAVYAWAKERWEMGLWRIFQIMLGLNILAYAVPFSAVASWLVPVFTAIFGVAPAEAHLHNAFLASMDLANVSALVWIWINGAPQNAGDASRLGKARAGLTPLLGFRRILHSLHRQRAHPPFWKVHG